MSLDYSCFGGNLITPDHPQAHLFGAASEPVWNFGRIEAPAAGVEVRRLLQSMGQPASLYEVAPHLRGVGEDRTVILHHLARGSLGKFLQSQYQNRGTCVSRGAKRVADLCQAIAIGFGAPFAFEYLSHAYIYGTCREHGGDLSNQDGAVGAWAAWSVGNDGNLRNSDVGDNDNDDALAVKWGARGVPSDIKSQGRLHLIKKVVPIASCEEARDWIASGIGGITVASNVGYEGQRNSQGVVRRRGSWSHQMCLTGWRHDRKQFLQDQSWGPDQPGGPIGDIEIPSYSWWTEWDDVAQQIRERDTFGFAWVDAWAALDVSYRP